jgi:hypothetical protein
VQGCVVDCKVRYSFTSELYAGALCQWQCALQSVGRNGGTTQAALNPSSTAVCRCFKVCLSVGPLLKQQYPVRAFPLLVTGRACMMGVTPYACSLASAGAQQGAPAIACHVGVGSAHKRLC